MGNRGHIVSLIDTETEGFKVPRLVSEVSEFILGPFDKGITQQKIESKCWMMGKFTGNTNF